MTGKTSPRGFSLLSFFIILIAISFAAGVHGDDVVPLNLGNQPLEHLAKVTSFFSVTSGKPGKTYPAAVVVEIDKDWHINSARPYQDWLIPAELTFDTIPGLTPHDVVYEEGIDAYLADQKMSVYHENIVIGFEITIDENMDEGEYVLPVNFTYQPCNNNECRPPRTEQVDLIVAVGEEGVPVNEEVFTRLANSAGPDSAAIDSVVAAGSVSGESDLQQLIDRYGFWGYFLALGLAFITGLLLSFSPCTYPMIPITVSIFAGQKRSVGKGFVMSLFYVGSMAVVYGIMGLIVSLVGGVFGAWLASTPVVIAITAVFVIFSLSMFGLYELQVPSSLRQKLGTVSSGGGVFGVIILGIVAALVVSPCVGPFVAGILLYIATNGSPVLGFLVLFVFALGLGTLYIILGTFSSAINALPGSGEWMESVKKFFGFVLLLMALYFLRTIISPTLTAILAGLILLALGVFGGGLDRLTHESKFFPRLKKFVGILALLVGLYLLAGTLITQGLILPAAYEWMPWPDQASVNSEKSLIDWSTNLDAGLERARLENKPVLIDTWATWCANCRVQDKKTFGNPRVAAEAARFVPLKIQLEKADSPQTREFMTRFGLKQYSLPTTLLLDSSGKIRRVLRGMVGPENMLAEMKKIS
jgi:thiol:disulfide interchange protein DsbD